MKERAEKILDEIIGAELAKPSKWRGTRFGGIKQIPNTNVGEVAEKFAAAMLCAAGYAAEQKDNRRGQWDVKAGGKTFEVKGASEDVGGSFQFNGVRYDTKYDLLLVVGISPNDIWFRIYPRRDLMEMPLVPMAKGMAGSYKLTRRPKDLRPIGDFPAEAQKFIGAPPMC